jgi:multiple sugar transport system substrate-binding protein
VGIEEKVQAGLAGGAAPDVVRLKDVKMAVLARQGGLVALDAYLARDKSEISTARFVASVWEAMQYKGKPYGLPFPGHYVMNWFQNDELVAAAGLDPAKAPATWADAREWARRTTDRVRGVWGHCFYELATREFNLLWFSMYLYQAGGELFDKDGTRFTLDTGPGQEALQFVVDLLQTDRTAVPEEEQDNRVALIKAGKVATWWRQSDVFGDYERTAPGLKYSVRVLPDGKRAADVVQPEAVLLTKDSKAPEVAWAFMKDLTQEQYDARWATLFGAIPNYRSSFTKEPFTTDPRWKAVGEASQRQGTRPRPRVDGYLTVAETVTPPLRDAWFGKLPVKPALADAERLGNEALAKAQKGS